MVVATQKSRQRLPDSDDSLARSLHKDVDYPAINVSRRSSEDGGTPLAPDCRYPNSERKRINTVLDTGWHTCFKNNNYVFVRNEKDAKTERQRGDKTKEKNSDVTFVIATTDPEKPGIEEKLIVSLQDSKPTIKKCSSSTPPDSSTAVTPNDKAKPTSNNKKDSSGKKKKSEKKNTPGWLKKLTPGRNKLKIEATIEETTPICDSSPEESRESAENAPPAKDKEPIRISPRPLEETPVIVADLIGVGPHTSTPKPVFDTKRNYKSLPRKSATPHKPFDGRYSVRRRLPIDMSPCKKEDDIFKKNTTTPKIATLDSDLSLDLSPLEKRASSHKRIMESPNFQSRMHPTLSLSDIPFADSVEDVSVDEKQSKITQTNTEDLLDDLSCDLSKSQSKLTQTLESDFMENVSFDDKPRRKIVRTLSSSQDISVSNKRPRRVTRANTMLSRPNRRDRCFSEPGDNRLLGSLPEMKSIREESMESKSISSSEPSLKVKRTQSCRAVQDPVSPMEEEENMSLDGHARRLQSPDDSTVTFSPLTPFKKPRMNAVSCWLKELRLLTETECLNALQAKEIAKEDWIASALAVGNAQERAERIWELGSVAGKHVEEMIEFLKKPKLSSTPFTLKVAQFCASVVDLLKMGVPGQQQQICMVEARIKKSCSELLDAANREEDKSEWKAKTLGELEAVQQSLKTIVKQFLLKQLQVIVECIDRASNVNCLKRSVFGIILMGRLDATFCELAVKLGAVRALLSIIIESKWKEMHPCALRALTVLSCVPTAIKSFEECGGVDCVCDVLCDEDSLEGARSEAAGLVAQITAPWTEGSSYVLQSINQNADRLVRSIAGLAKKTDSSEVFLLSSAALANLSFADEVLKRMKDNRVLEILVAACRSRSHATSLFIKDQVATVLANMAAKEEYRDELATGGSLVLLLHFLQLRPSMGHGAPQLAACERVQQKAAIALARLCSNKETSNIVAEMQGIQRLVKLCKDRKERNDSDSVLVACLAALRKIAAVRQKEEFKKLGAQELVEPRLWDAFLAHSSKRESYV